MVIKPMMSIKKPKSVDPSSAAFKGGGKFSKAGGILGALSDVVGLVTGIAGKKKKKNLYEQTK